MAKKRLPDFIIGGAPRSGTTWLYHLLDRHPGIFMARPIAPEPKFFLVDELYSKGIDQYSSTWFANVPEDRLCGEKTTNYLESPVVAGRIHAHLPEVKLIFILRDPVERAFSNYLWSRMNGLEQKDFATALSLEEERERTLTPEKRYARPHAYFSRGLYADLLAPYYELFPREQILCLRYEDINERPGLLAERLHAFLGVAQRHDDCRDLGVINRALGEGTETMPMKVRDELQRAYEPQNRKLGSLLGPPFELWRYRT